MKPHILVVDDYPANVMIATTFVEQFGYTFDVAVDGVEAVECIKKNNYAAVIMDVQMPNMSGLEATRTVRNYERENNKIPVFIIAMTAQALAQDRERCLSAGMDDYISKPFNPEELRRKLGERISEMA